MPERSLDPAARARFDRLARIAHWMDEAFRVPGTRFRFGLDSLIGLVPVVGDVVTLGMSGYTLWLAYRIGMPASVLLRMLANLGIDFALGYLPVFGDAVDFFVKANTRNLRLLERELARRLDSD